MAHWKNKYHCDLLDNRKHYDLLRKEMKQSWYALGWDDKDNYWVIYNDSVFKIDVSTELEEHPKYIEAQRHGLTKHKIEKHFLDFKEYFVIYRKQV